MIMEEKNMTDTFTLNNGIKMPSVGIGTFLLSPEKAESSVKAALTDGYRLIDTANAYVNERAVGRGMKESGIDRGDIFLSTKIWPSEYENPNAIDETMERLGVEVIDLLFLHQPAGNWKAGYRMLEKAYRDGKIRSIGISNFEREYLDELLMFAEIKPQVMQVECHPFYPQTGLRKITDPENIRLMSWYPLGGKGQTKELLSSSVIREIAGKYHKSSAQVVLRWHVQMGNVVIPGSSNPEHIKANLDLFDFELAEEDMKSIAALDNGQRRYIRTDEALKRFAARQPEYEKA